LNTNAVPSIFSGFPTHLLKPLPVKRRLLQRNCTNNIHYVPTNFYDNLPNNSNLNAGTSVCDESSVETKVEEVIDSSEKVVNFILCLTKISSLKIVYCLFLFIIC